MYTILSTGSNPLKMFCFFQYLSINLLNILYKISKCTHLFTIKSKNFKHLTKSATFLLLSMNYDN